jgi:hypothetical protein
VKVVRKFAALLLVAASCATEEPKETEQVRKAFEDWAKATMAGNAEKSLAMLSDAKKSEWLYDRLEENDPLARRWRGELSGPARTDLDLWWGVAHKRRSGRAESLKDTVLAHPAFIQLFKDYFGQTATAIRTQFSRLEIMKVYADDTGITVIVKCGMGAPTEMYGLIFEREGWKIDTYRQPLAMQK